MNKEYIVIGILVILAFSALSWTIYSAFYGANYKKAMAAQNNSDICKAPAGYTQDQWNTHMSHHPNIYSQCLKK